MGELVRTGTALEPQAVARARILDIEAKVGAMPQIECKLAHHFAPGAYGREILLPRGSLVVGKLHRHAHLNIISMGRVSVFTEEGIKIYKAPLTFVSFPGTKRVVYAHEDTIWTTVHPTDKTDLADIEREVIAPDYVALDHKGEMEPAEPVSEG